MSRWCGENALPKDLRCLGVHPQDANLVPGSQAVNHFQPLQKLLENTAAGIQYMPVRLGKGAYSDEGPATPQSAPPPKGSRAPGTGPGGLGSNAQGLPAGAQPLNGGPDVTRAMDQRSALAAAAAAAAASGGLNGFPAQQQAGGLQGHPLTAHLAQMQQARPGSQPRQPQQQPQQQGTPGRRPTPQPGGGGPPNQFMHEQAAGGMQQFAGGPPGGGGGDGSEAGELTPNDADWEPALLKLIKRGGFVGKEADVKWRVILASGVSTTSVHVGGTNSNAGEKVYVCPVDVLRATAKGGRRSAVWVYRQQTRLPGAQLVSSLVWWSQALKCRAAGQYKDGVQLQWMPSLVSHTVLLPACLPATLFTGDRVGPFSTDQMVDWLLAGKPPKGINKQQAQQTSQNPPALQVAGILSSDYNAQRLPGAKFFKPLGTLLALVAAGMQYQAVNKHDLQRGLPNKGWNEGVAAGGAKAAGATPPLPTGKGAAGKAGKAAAAAARGGAAAGGKNAQAPGARGNSAQQPGNRSRSSTPAGASDASEGPAASATSSKSSSFKHPMALRQQQRQQEALLAAAGQGLPGQPGGQNPPGAGAPGKGLPPGAGRPGAGRAGGAPMSQPGSASRSIMAAANSMGAAAGLPAGLQQQQQLALSAQQAAAGRIAQGLAGPQQQFLTPQQMQAASMAFLQAQPGASQAVWLKQQQQMPGQALAGVYPAGQTLLGPYPGMPGAHPLNPMAAAAGGQGGDAGLPRSSSTGSCAQQQPQQPPPPGAPGAHGNPVMQQQQLAQMAGDGQAWQLQQQAAGGVRPPMGAPQIAMVQPGVSPSPQHMHAAALLFLHDQQQQQQPQQPPRPDKPQARWWVQRGTTSFAGPFTGLQMYQAYWQPTGPLRLTEAMSIAAVAAPAANAAAAGTRDVPPTHTHAFAPLSCLLEAAAQGFVLVPWPSAAGGRQDGQPNTLLVQQLQSGATVPLQNVLSQPGLLALQQQQQHPGGGAGEQQGGEGGSSNEQQQQLLAAKQRQQQQQPQPQMMSAVRPAAGGYIQLPNGQLVPAAGLVPVQGGGLAMLQANPAAAAVPQPPTVDPLAVANALFTAGGQPNTIVWYIRTDGPASSEGQQSSSIQGPFDPQVRAG